MRGHKLPDETRARIIKMHADGATHQQIADAVHVGKSTVERVIRQNREKITARVTENEIDDIASDKPEKARPELPTVAKIASQLGMTYGALMSHLAAGNLREAVAPTEVKTSSIAANIKNPPALLTQERAK